MRYIRHKYIDVYGFTLIEIMVTIGIAAIIFTMGGARYNEFNKAQTIQQAGQTLKNNLRDVQSKAQAGVKPTASNCLDPETLVGYSVGSYTSPYTQYFSEGVCSGGGGPSGVTTTYTLPAGLEFSTTWALQFLVLARGTTCTTGCPIIIRNNTTNASSNKWYAVCVSASGDIKDCGYKSGAGAPTCAC